MTTDILTTVTALPVADIRVGTRLRPLFEPAVEALIRVIGDHGFTVPILVRRTKKGDVLVDGLHRLTAETRRGSATIPVVVVTCTDAEAQAMEASQNLAGAAMSPLDDALFLAAYSDAYLKMHPETARGMAGALAKKGVQANSSSFAEIVAEKRAVSPRQVQKIARAGRMISHDEAMQMRLCGQKVTLQDVIAVAKVGDVARRAKAIARFVANEAPTIRAALKAESGPTETSVQDDVEAGFQALQKLWARVPQRARRAFVAARRDALLDLIGDVDGGEGAE